MAFNSTLDATKLATAETLEFTNGSATKSVTGGKTYKINIADISKLEATLQSKVSNFDFALYDSVGQLYYANNTAIKSEKPSLIPDNLSVTLLNGTYYLDILNVNSVTGASFSLTMKEIPLTPTDLAGKDQDTSLLITPNYTDQVIANPDDYKTDGYVGGGTDTVDYYKFQITGVNKKVQVQLTGFNDNSVKAVLTNNTGLSKSLGVANSTTVTTTVDLAINLDATDYYYIQVLPTDTGSDSLTPYQLNIQYLDDVGNIKENAKTLSDTVITIGTTDYSALVDQYDKLSNLYPLSATYSEYVDSKDTHDWYKIILADDPDTPTYNVDWYSIGINLGVAITTANPKATTADVNLKLYNTDGTEVKSGSVTKVDSQNSDIIFDRLQAGTYYIDVTPAKTTGTEYNIGVRSTSYGIKDDIAGNTIPEANPDLLKKIDEAVVITDAVGLADPYDYFQFKIDNLSTLKIEVTNGAPKYEIVDPTGKSIKGTDLPKGTYYLKVSSTVSPVEDYSMTVQRTDWTPSTDNAGNDIANANTKSIGTVDLTKSVKNPISDYIGLTDPYDYYQVVIPSFAVADANGNYGDDGYRYSIKVKNEISSSLPNQNVDFSMLVVDESDNVITTSSDLKTTGTRTTELNTTTLKAGTYYVRVSSSANPAYQYNLNVALSTNTNPTDNNNVISSITNADNIIATPITTTGITKTQFVGGSSYAVNGVYDSYDYYVIQSKPNPGEDWKITSKAPFSIVNSAGKLLLDSKSAGTLNYQTFLKPTLIDANQYLYIKVDGTSYKTPTQYDLTIASVATADLAGNQISDANTKQIGELKLGTVATISDYLGGSDDNADYYAFTLPKANDKNVFNLNVIAKTLQSANGVSIDLFDKYGNTLNYATSVGGVSNSQAGAYFTSTGTTSVDFYSLEKYADPTKPTAVDTTENLVGGETYYIRVTPNTSSDFALYSLNLNLSARYDDPNDTTSELAIAPKDIYNLGFPTSAGQFVSAKEDTTKPSIGGYYSNGTDGDIIDYFYFTTPSSLNDQQYKLDFDKKSGVNISIENANGVELVNFGSTSGGGTLNSKLYSAFSNVTNAVLSQNTTYYVKLVADSSITKPSDYTLKLTSNKLDDIAGNTVKNGNTTALASASTYSASPVNTTISDFIGTVDSLDYYTINVTGSPVRLTLTNSSINNTQTFGSTSFNAVMNPTTTQVAYTIVDENDKTVSIASRENQYFDFDTETLKSNATGADSYILPVGKYAIKLANNTATPADRYSLQVQIDPSVSNHMDLDSGISSIQVSKNNAGENVLTQFTADNTKYYDDSISQFKSSANSLGNIVSQNQNSNLTLTTTASATPTALKYTGTDYSTYTNKNIVGNNPVISAITTNGSASYAIIAFESNDTDLIATLIAGVTTNADTIAIAQEKAKTIQNAIIVGKITATNGVLTANITDLSILSTNPDVANGYLYNAFNPSISDDGKKLAFTAYPEATAGVTKAYSSTLGFVPTATTPTAKWSVANLALTKDASYSSGGAIISADGKSIAFTTNAKKVTGELDTKNQAIDEDNFYDVYVKNATGTKLVSRASSSLSTDGKTKIGGNKGNNSSGNVLTPLAISSDGKYVVFSSSASNLVTNDQNSASDIFVRDTINDRTSIVSMSVNGLQPLYNSNPKAKPVMQSVSISPDGRYISFSGQNISLTVSDSTQTSGMKDVTGEAFVTPNPLFTIDAFGREVNHIRDYATPIELIADKDVEGTDKLIGGIDDTTDYYVFIPKANYDISYTFTGKSTDGNALDQGVFDGRLRFERGDGSEITPTNGTLLGTDLVAGQPVYVKIDGNELTSASYSLKLKATSSTVTDRDNNGTFNTAKRLTFTRSGITKTDIIGGSTDRDDFFKIIVPANKSFSASLIDRTSGDYKTDYLTIYNSVGQPLNLSNATTPKLDIPQKTYDQLYYVKVSNYAQISKRKSYVLNIAPVMMSLDSASDTGKANDYITNDATPTLHGQLTDPTSTSILSVYYKNANGVSTLVSNLGNVIKPNSQTGEWTYTVDSLVSEFSQAYGNGSYVFEIKTTSTTVVTTDVIEVIVDTKIPVVTDASIQLNFASGSSPFSNDTSTKYVNATENAQALFVKFAISDLQYANPAYTWANAPADDDTIQITWNGTALPNSGKYIDYYKTATNEYILSIPASTLTQSDLGILAIQIKDIAGNQSTVKTLQFGVDTEVTNVSDLKLINITNTTISYASGADVQKDTVKGLRVVLNPAVATKATDVIKVYLNGGSTPVLTKTIGTISASNTYDFNESEIQAILGNLAGGSAVKFTAKVEDVAGNISAIYDNFLSFNMILKATTTPTVTGLLTADDSGTSGDNTTNIASPRITGTAEANSTVTLYNNGTPLGSTVANSSGVWQYQIPAVSVSTTLNLTAKATKTGQSDSVVSEAKAVSIDLASPATPTVLLSANRAGSTVTDEFKKDDYINKAEQTAGYSLDVKFGTDVVAGDIIRLYWTSPDNLTGTDIIPSYVVTATDVTNKYAPLTISSNFALGADGLKTFGATITDKAGNISQVGEKSLTLDTIAPTISSVKIGTTTLEANKKATLNLSSELTVTVNEAAQVQINNTFSSIKVDDKDLATSSTSNGLILAYPLADHKSLWTEHTVNIPTGSIYDIAGNTNGSAYNYTYMFSVDTSSSTIAFEGKRGPTWLSTGRDGSLGTINSSQLLNNYIYFYSIDDVTNADTIFYKDGTYQSNNTDSRAVYLSTAISAVDFSKLTSYADIRQPRVFVAGTKSYNNDTVAGIQSYSYKASNDGDYIFGNQDVTSNITGGTGVDTFVIEHDPSTMPTKLGSLIFNNMELGKDKIGFLKDTSTSYASIKDNLDLDADALTLVTDIINIDPAVMSPIIAMRDAQNAHTINLYVYDLLSTKQIATLHFKDDLTAYDADPAGLQTKLRSMMVFTQQGLAENTPPLSDTKNIDDLILLDRQNGNLDNVKIANPDVNHITQVINFEYTNDRINLVLPSFDNDSAVLGTAGSPMNANAFEISTGAPTNGKSTTSRIIADNSNPAFVDLYWDKDGNGTTLPTKFATLVNVFDSGNISASNFNIVGS